MPLESVYLPQRYKEPDPDYVINPLVTVLLLVLCIYYLPPPPSYDIYKIVGTPRRRVAVGDKFNSHVPHLLQGHQKIDNRFGKSSQQCEG